MYFILIRIVILSLFVAIVFLARYKSKKSFAEKIHFAIGVFSVGIVLATLSAIFPFENVFITFETAQEAFSYACTGEAEYKLEGEDSCLFVYSKDDNTYSHFIVKKENGGYKIANQYSLKTLSKNFSEAGHFVIYRVKNSEDYYVFFSVNPKENESTIKLLSASGEEIGVNIVRVKESNFYYFYTNEPPENYRISLSGEITAIQ